MAQKDLNSGNRWTAARINGAFARGEIAWTKRGTTAGPTSGATELPLLRLDNVALESGRSYMIIASELRVDFSVTTDHFKFNLRYSTSGAATVSSTVLTRSEITGDLDSFPPLIAFRRPSTAETGSFLLSVVRTAASGTGTVQADDDNDIQLSVQDLGLATADTGVVL